MSMRTGQVTIRQALLGALLSVAVIALVVSGLEALLAGPRQPPLPDTPAESSAKSSTDTPCPADLRVREEPIGVTAEALIECPATFDGFLVRYRGEVVRAVLRRGDHAWVHLNDDGYALDVGPLPEQRILLGVNSGIPARIPLGVAEQIEHVGSYQAQGATLTVEGIFRRADPADDGGPAIEVLQARVERPGHRIRHHPSPTRVVVAVVLIAAALVATLRTQQVRRRS